MRRPKTFWLLFLVFLVVAPLVTYSLFVVVDFSGVRHSDGVTAVRPPANVHYADNSKVASEKPGIGAVLAGSENLVFASLLLGKPEINFPACSLPKAELEKIFSSENIGNVGINFMDAASGKELYSSLNHPLTPASNMKLVTAAVSIAIFGPDHRFTTRVVTSEAGHAVLVGSGDPYLLASADPDEPGAPSIEKLAQDTSLALKSRKISHITVDWDSSLFTGPNWAPTWPKNYKYEVAPISALAIKGGDRRGASGALLTNQDQIATMVFVQYLRNFGIDAKLGIRAKTNARSSAGNELLAQIQSLTVAQLIAKYLDPSDNNMAEMMGRLNAIAKGYEGSFSGATKVAEEYLKEWGLWESGVRLVDASGLSMENKLTPLLLTRLVRKIVITPQLTSVANAMPISGETGTLQNRFTAVETEEARGKIHAKTGTLNGVATLSGYVELPNKSELIFSILANDVADNFQAVNWIDVNLTKVSQLRCS